jgi:hypothetical protein
VLHSVFHDEVLKYSVLTLPILNEASGTYSCTVSSFLGNDTKFFKLEIPGNKGVMNFGFTLRKNIVGMNFVFFQKSFYPV